MLDVSASISSDTYDRIAATLDRLDPLERPYGLVLFSDTAYLALPPGTAAPSCEPLLRFFRPAGTGGGPSAAAPEPLDGRVQRRHAHLDGSLARADEIREPRLSRPAVVLVSDLDDDTATSTG